jgi:hypothetical protein
MMDTNYEMLEQRNELLEAAEALIALFVAMQKRGNPFDSCTARWMLSIEEVKRLHAAVVRARGAK